ncbi:MAG: RsmD family RNA methyltransferase [Actinobacteria bacterium]|nr:RsmD family RNA methyltransferase [Actinomycetota bacterium]
MTTSTTTTRTCPFGPLVVEYDARVLTPRPWTLAQSHWAVEVLSDYDDGARLLELCAGAGHIGLAAAVTAERDLLQVELDPVAAAYAASNARRAGWSEHVEIRVGPLQAALQTGERFRVIVADPPYLRSEAIERWPLDPVRAIDGGLDGLDLVRACLDVAAHHLEPGGCLLLQVAGPSQATQVEKLLATPVLKAGEVRAIDPERAIMRIDHT